MSAHAFHTDFGLAVSIDRIVHGVCRGRVETSAARKSANACGNPLFGVVSTERVDCLYVDVRA